MKFVISHHMCKTLIKTFAVLLLILSARGTVYSQSSGNQQFQIKPHSGLILVPVRIGERTYPFFVDTGSTHTTFDSQLEFLLGKSLGATPVIGGPVAKMYAWPKAYLGTMELRTDSPVLCLDLTHFREHTGQEFMGILGMDWLKTSAFVIDPDGGTVTFLSKPKLPPSALSNGIPITFHDGRLPFVDVFVPGLGTIEFLIDTGELSDGRLRKEDFLALRQSSKLDYIFKSSASSIFIKSPSIMAPVRSFAIGEFHHESLLLACHREDPAFSDKAFGIVTR